MVIQAMTRFSRHREQGFSLQMQRTSGSELCHFNNKSECSVLGRDSTLSRGGNRTSMRNFNCFGTLLPMVQTILP